MLSPPSASERSALLAAVVRRLRAIADSPEMVAIRWALPVSFIGLFIGLGAFMLHADGTLLQRFQLSFAAAFGVMSALLVMVLAYDLAPRRAVPRWLALAVVAVAFGLSLPYERHESFEGLATSLGSSGLFLAIGIALATVAALAAGRARLGIVAGSLAGAFAVIGVALGLRAYGISLTAALDFLIAPLGHLGDSLTALLIITLVETLLWTVGIHGPALLAAVVLPVYVNLQLANTQALAHDRPLPHIVTVSMFLFVFPGGAGATLPLVLLLLRSKVRRIRRVAYATILPSLINANEPLMFGLPLVLNPVLGVPFVLAPLVLAALSYEAMALGFVARPAYYIPSTIPIPVGAFLATRDWRGVVLMLVNIAVALLIYLPFVNAYERAERARGEGSGRRVIEALLERFAVAGDVAEAARRASGRIDPAAHDAVAGAVRANVLAAFAAEGVAESDLAGSYGYGYDDAARAHYEALLARIFGTQRALARFSFVSGTHAIVATLEACTPAGGRLISATGRPYDTLRNAIVDAPHALVRRGLQYDEIPLAEGGGVAYDALSRACAMGVDTVFVQRSRGYAPRRSLTARACGEVADVVRASAPQARVLVDNCYGELVEASEPTHYGVDAVMGSLIKNVGGGLAPGGGYVAGSADVVERVAARHYAPGLGDALGPTFGFGRTLLQGLFYAPLIVAESLAGLDFAAALFAELGYRVDPLPGGERSDIVQAIALGTPERLIAFARGLQRAMPVNARFAPEPGPVPGYRDPVIMSSGAFVAGATIELSCDAPLRAPYEMYLQGGTNRDHVALGALLAADALRL